MSATSPATTAVPPAPGSQRTRWELPVLGILAVLTFAMIPISINTVPGGLPAHPLFVHVPVIFIPLAAIGGLVLMVRPRWLRGDAGPWVGLAAVIALGSLDLTMNAGSHLRTDLGLDNPAAGGVAHIISQHAAAAGVLRVFFIAFTALFLIVLAVNATDGGRSSGVPVGDRIFAGIRSVTIAPLALRVLTAVLGLICLFYVYRVGDLGAKAVWYAQLHDGR
jgi:uncharacterized membrane protein